MAFAESITLPPPKPIIRSKSDSRAFRTPWIISSFVGSPRISKVENSIPVSPSIERNGSDRAEFPPCTTRTRLPRFAAIEPISFSFPGPNKIRVAVANSNCVVTIPCPLERDSQISRLGVALPSWKRPPPAIRGNEQSLCAPGPPLRPGRLQPVQNDSDHPLVE